MTDESPAALAQSLPIFVGRLRRRLQEASATEGLSAPQASVLARLSVTEPSSASELAGAERVRPQSMAATLIALHGRGLIRREPDPDDGRRQLIWLTDEGRAHADGARANRKDWLAAALAERATDRERRVIADALVVLDRVVEP